jgi:hypothetical protein
VAQTRYLLRVTGSIAVGHRSGRYAAWMGKLLAKYGVPVTVHIQPGTYDWTYAMNALQYSFTFLADNWRQAAATDTGWNPES